MTWRIDGVTVRQGGGSVALDGVTVAVEPGALHAVIGGDGAGKTTLLRVLAGLGIVSAGRVALPPQAQIGYVPAAGGVFGDLTVDENMAFVADVHHLRGWRPRAEELLAASGIDAFGDRLARQLSGGQRRKLAGSMAMLPRPALLVLDEVTTGVDPVSRVELWRLVAAAVAADTGVVVATTYLDEAERADDVSFLHRGRVLASGPPAEIVAGIPGTISDEDAPIDRALAWRHGRRWHQWHPGPAGERTGHEPTLEDAAIVLELQAEGRAA
jgi:ABC-2 type transport system ATP-binding protein